MIINKEYSIKSDQYNIILIKHGISEKTGEETKTNVAYFNSVGSALKHMVKNEIFGTGFDELQDVHDRITALEKTIDSLNMEKVEV